MSERPAYRTTIREMPAAERPRERLAQYGAATLKTSELLAILLRTGDRQRSALDLGEAIIHHYGSLGALARAAIEDLQQFPGVGPAKAVELVAACELGRRLMAAAPEERPTIQGPEDVAALLGAELRDLDREHFKVLLLNTKNQVLKIETVSVGSLNASVVHPRECFKLAVAASANGVIFAHNHPSGDPTPSREDRELTTRLVEAGDVLGIAVLDHVVLGGNSFVSLRAQGVID